MIDKGSCFRTVVDRINKLAIDDGYAIANLQRIRANGKRRAFRNIFTGHSIFDNYAFHTGGRSEFQFNVAIENHGNGETRFRYGLAFSLQSGMNLPDPVGTFTPRITAFNHFFQTHSNELKGILLWKYAEEHEAPRPLHEIPLEWIQSNAFIFLGKYISKKIDELTDQDLHEILVFLDKLLPMYEYVEHHYGDFSSGRQQRLAKICWNNNGWQYPSGPEGKSEDKNTHESSFGYGHEEWLFDFDKTIEGYHYAYLQPVGKHREKYTGEVFDIDLYSLNSREKRSYWIAELKSVEIIDKHAEGNAIEVYRERGWLNEMLADLKLVGADVGNFEEWIDEVGLFNIRFRPEDVYSYGAEPVPFADNEKISHTRYTLLYKDGSQGNRRSNLKLGPGVDSKEIYSSKEQRRNLCFIECSQLHDHIQNGFSEYLRKLYPNDRIKLEVKTSYGTAIDLYRKSVDGVTYFYEVKTFPSAKACIREALGQLYEYAFYPDENLADHLIIVSQAPLNSEVRKYLRHLQEKFHLPISYVQFDHEKEEVIEMI